MGIFFVDFQAFWIDIYQTQLRDDHDLAEMGATIILQLVRIDGQARWT